MKENVLNKYYYYLLAIISYCILSIKNKRKNQQIIVNHLIAPKTIGDMYKRYGLLNLLRAACRAPQNLNFSTSAITLYRNVYHPNIKKSVLSTSLEVTNNCPYRCKGCYIDIIKKKSNYFMPENLLRKVITLLQHSEFIIIQGGEPCQEQYVDILYRVIKDYPCQSFIICTSGVYISKYGVGKFKYLNNILWAISINGAKDTNDSLRFKGSFDHAINAMINIRNVQQYFVAVTTASRASIESATSNDFVMLMANIGVKEIKYLILRDPSSGMQLSKKEVEHWSNYTKRYNKYIFTTFSIDNIEGYSVIDPYGNRRFDRTGHDNDFE